jgi:hypothetical protein
VGADYLGARYALEHGQAAQVILLNVQEPRSTELTVWAAAIDEPQLFPSTLAIVETSGRVPSISLESWDGGIDGDRRHVRYRRVRVGGLDAGRRYRFELRHGGLVLGTAAGDTLPNRLPSLDERPFTILLGSCFARQNDGAGEVGRAFSLLPSGARPSLKILCGDQVYLDGFGLQTVFSAIDRAGLTDRFIETYAKAWTQEPGFGTMLRGGATLFSSDDHDYWNNAPNSSVTAPQTYLPGVADRWWAIASGMFEAFQRRLNQPQRTFAIGDLSLYLADTRIERSRGQSAFMSEPELRGLESWAASLTGPGLLVVGQLIFTPRGSFIDRLKDLGLADFEAQYERLVRALRGAPHSVVILTGDVHFGRVVRTQLGMGPEIIEVVASPLTLIFPGNNWKPAPSRFPTDGPADLPGWPVTTDAGYNINEDHFATLEFARSGAFVRMRVRAWPIHTVGLPPWPTHQAEFMLQ